VKDCSRYFQPGYLDAPRVAGCHMPSDHAIAAGEAARRAAAAMGSQELLRRIHRLLEREVRR
jgi:hypothetical protein